MYRGTTSRPSNANCRSGCIEHFQLSLRTLTYDGTNFFTFIDTRTPAELPQRGHNKQKRNDLRQVSLGMLVSTDFHVPLFHKVYAGNVTDCTIFQTVTEELRVRYRELARDCEHITLIFDKGNNGGGVRRRWTRPTSTSSVRWCPATTRTCWTCRPAATSR